MSLSRRTFTKEFEEGAVRRQGWALVPFRRLPPSEKPTFQSQP